MQIVLATLNARWIHAAFGLRYLHANLGDLRDDAKILEFTNSERPIDIAEAILAENPRVVGLGVYVWNAVETLELVRLLRAIAPDVRIVVGGPEVSHETKEQELCELAHHVVTGEADLVFADVCERLLRGDKVEHIVAAPTPAPDDLVLPYRLYHDEDIAHRILYVEASRGCPFRCEFCLSSLDRGVRAFDLDRFLGELESLYDRGARTFKFVDRTFNMRIDNTTRILQFFLDREEPTFAHFEMIPDRFPVELRDVVTQFARGRLQFEVGIQTFDPEVSKRISRRQDYDRIADNLAFLRDETEVHVHADLIVGLPGETLASFGRGFDTLVALGPQEIQVGILKRLRGTPIIRHDEEFGMVWSQTAPYELLCNADLDFAAMQHLRRFSRYWDLIANSGNFVETLPLLWHDTTPFDGFSAFTTWVWEETGATARISLRRLVALLFDYLTKTLDREIVGPPLLRDYQSPGRPDVPPLLRDFDSARRRTNVASAAPSRQARHGSVGE